MNASEQIEMAKAYVALSNAHRLEFILPLLAEQVVYHSAYVGTFEGRRAIGEMMAGFFARFPDGYWTVSEYRWVGDSTVEFAFVMTATEASTGQAIERRGIETLSFTDDGRMARLDVIPFPYQS